MPIFEFKCDSCEEGFELLVRSSEELVHCPQCGSSEVKKQFSTFASKGASSGASKGMDSGHSHGGGCCGGGCGCAH